MKIYLATAVVDRSKSSIPFFERSASIASSKEHQVVERPQDSDIILFVDSHCSADLLMRPFLRHRLTKQYRGEIFVYDERDTPWCAFPGVYVSMPASTFDKDRQRAFSYPFHLNDLIENYAKNDTEGEKLLFSFIGGNTHKIRKKIVALNDPRSHIEINTVGMFDFENPATKGKRDFQKRRFIDLQQKSKFILYPRGSGSSSIRLFETMAMGRAPVIISDEWVAPSGPDSGKFSLRVPESQIASIPDLLKEKEDLAEEMGRIAKNTYEEWFSPQVIFSNIAFLCEDIYNNCENLGLNNRPLFDRQFRRCVSKYLVDRFYVQGGALKRVAYRKFNK